MSNDGCCCRMVEQVARLTRERDEARAERNAARIQRDVALASAASPEVLRVVEAAKRVRDCYDGLCTMGGSPAGELCDSVDALLSASRQPKAQEPRATIEWSTTNFSGYVRNGDRLHGPFMADVCRKLAAILNAEAK